MLIPTGWAYATSWNNLKSLYIPIFNKAQLRLVSLAVKQSFQDYKKLKRYDSLNNASLQDVSKKCTYILCNGHGENLGAQWHSSRVLGSRSRSHRFEPHRRHCLVSLSKNINPSLVLVQPRKTCPFINKRLLIKSNKKHGENIVHPGLYLLQLSPSQTNYIGE